MSSETIIHVSSPVLDKKIQEARAYLEQARYKQAIRLFEDILTHQMSLIETLRVRAELAFAYALWRKAENAIDEASQILAAVRADTSDLPFSEIDWEYEKSEDIGHLAFLADVFQLRGTLFRVRRNARRAVEDLTLSIYMTREDARNMLNYLHRAAALIELGDCLERALADLEHVRKTSPDVLCAYFSWDECQGHFELEEQHIVFVQDDERRQKIAPSDVKLKARRVQPEWFRLREFLQLDR